MKLKLPHSCCLIALLVASTATLVSAHETDQYTLPAGREFVDLGAHFNRFFYDAIERGVNKTNARIRADLASKRDPSRHQTNDAIAFAVNREFPVALFLIEGLDNNMTKPRMKDRWPGALPAYKPPPSVTKYLLYPLNPFRAWNCATLKVYGAYLGTDKIGHFTDMGMHYYRTYRGYLRKGESEEQAIKRAIAVGTTDPIKSESGVLGYWTAGAYSNADLCANYFGMLFYRNLTEPQRLKGQLRPPMVVRDGEYWVLAPHVKRESDFMAWFFSDHYDEVLNPSRYFPQMREGMRKMAREHASAILELRRDDYGNRRPQEYFRELSKDLRTMWGVDYGHRGSDDELVLIGEQCFPVGSELSDDPSSRDALGRTPLHRAAEAGDLQRAQKLLASGADANAPQRSNEDLSSDWGNTPLHAAALNGRLEIVTLLLQQGADVNAANDRGATALHLAVEHPKVLAALLSNGAQINARDARGQSVVHLAAKGDAGESIALLLAGGADANAQDHAGLSPLHLAARSGAENAAAVLAEQGADLNIVDQLALTPLHLSATHKSLDVAEILINAGASIDPRDSFGCTPLHEATRRKSQSLVAFLLEAGAHPTIPDAYGTTPLHLASRHGDSVVARLLLERGADATVRAGSRGTPIDEARRAGHLAVLAVLRADSDAEAKLAASKKQ